jgi:hypothetical protein
MQVCLLHLVGPNGVGLRDVLHDADRPPRSQLQLIRGRLLEAAVGRRGQLVDAPPLCVRALDCRVRGHVGRVAGARHAG